MSILAIDPGNTESAWVLIDPETFKPLAFGKEANEFLRAKLWREELTVPFTHVSIAAIEMVASYGMAVGADVFETCVWVGRFMEALDPDAADVRLVKRNPIKLHHCKSSKAKDTNITQALVDRFTPGQPNYGKGTKANPGWFFGFFKDIWQAYALAVYLADTTSG